MLLSGPYRASIPALLICICWPTCASSREGESAPTEPLLMARRIDQLLERHLVAEQITPARISSDSEFLRRVYLDLTGVVPSVAEARQFLSSQQPERRPALIASLLQSPRHASHMATTWQRILLPNGVEPRERQNAELLRIWLRDQFADNHRYDRLVADFLLASGPTGNGPALFYRALEFKPEKLAAQTARIFLGLQIQCAECHDHPFDRWTQRDFWGYAAFFAQLQQPDMNNMADQQQLRDLDRGEVTMPGEDQAVPPKYPGGRLADATEGGSRRMQLAIWMASQDNPYLARRAVNWAWAHMFGRGLVDPADDLGTHNPASHPKLYSELTDFFTATSFDIHKLLQALANTKAYQRTSEFDDGRADSSSDFARMATKTLTAQQLYDSFQRNVLHRPAGSPSTANDRDRPDVQREAFINQLRTNTTGATQYDRGVLQSLFMMNGNATSAATDVESSSLLRAVNAPFFSNDDRLDVLFLATLSRYPRPDERERFRSYLNAARDAPDDRRRPLTDILWVLLNTSEFTLNH